MSSHGAHSAPSEMGGGAAPPSQAFFASRRSLPGEPSAQWWPCVSSARDVAMPLADDMDGVAVVVPESGGGMERRPSFFDPEGSTRSGFDAAQPMRVRSVRGEG